MNETRNQFSFHDDIQNGSKEKFGGCGLFPFSNEKDDTSPHALAVLLQPIMRAISKQDQMKTPIIIFTTQIGGGSFTTSLVE